MERYLLFPGTREITVLMRNARKDSTLKDLKFHFGKWDGEVMEYLYASDKEDNVTLEDALQEEIDEIERARQMKINLESARQQAAAAHQQQH